MLSRILSLARSLLLIAVLLLAMVAAPPPRAYAVTDPGLLISEVFTNAPGNDSPFEYVELLATRAIDFAATPYSVVFANNGIAEADGWVNGGTVTYGFSITSGSVTAGEVVYVGGASMAPTGRKLRAINTLTTGGDRFGSANTGVLGNGGANADGVAVFAANINSLTGSTAPVDAVFFGGTVGAAVVSGGGAGYELPLNDRYSGGKLQAGSFFAPEPVEGQALVATGTFNTFIGSITATRSWANAAPTGNISAITLSNDSGANRPVVPSCGSGPLSTVAGAAAGRGLSASDGDGTVTAAQITSAAVSGISLVGFSPAASVGLTATVTLGVAPTTPAGAYNVAVRFSNSDPSPQATTCTVLVEVIELTRIRAIQGQAHVSPLAGPILNNATTIGAQVLTPGVVTALRANGFFMQDPEPDDNPATSEGIFVVTGAAPTVQVGDAVLVRGNAAESRSGCTTSACTLPGDTDWYNLTTTQIVNPAITVGASGTPLPPATVIGAGGRTPPTEVMDNDTAGSVEVAAETTFDPAGDGLDFYESLEGMLVQLNSPVAVSPTRVFGSGSSLGREVPVLPDSGSGAGLRAGRGGVVLRQNDVNPERIFLSDTLLGGDAGDPVLPLTNVGDIFADPVVGVLDYTNANYKLLLTAVPPTPTAGGLTKQTLSLPAPTANQLTVATLNLEGLAGNGDQARFAAVAQVIVTGLGAPDIVALQEVYDNDGFTNSGIVSATNTLSRLSQAIRTQGGPNYRSLQIDPLDDQDGGELGANSRVVLLYRTDRGLSFTGQPGATAITPNEVLNLSGVPQLRYNPGRVNPAGAAFANSAKSLAAEFRFNRRQLFVIANQLIRKAGDEPIAGRFQPPDPISEAQRLQQAQAVAEFVDAIQAISPGALVVVLGELNDTEFSQPVSALEAAGLSTLIERLPAAERYTTIFQGNAQATSHILLSQSALDLLQGYEVVHLNTEFLDQISDHDPQAARLELVAPPNTRPSLNSVAVLRGATAGRPLTITYEALAAAANEADADGDPLTFRIEQVLEGALTKGGVAVTPGVTTLGPGERLVYLPARTGAALPSFSVVVSDGAAVSTPAVTVQIEVRNRVWLPLLRR